MDIKGNGIDYNEEKGNIPEEFKNIASIQSKITNNILKSKGTSKDTIRIVGPCSKWIEGEGWVTEIPKKVLAKKIEELLEETEPSIEGFNNTFWLLILAYIFSGGKKDE